MASTDDVATYLTDMDDQIAACRAWGHEWPSRKLRPGRPLPKGFTPHLMNDGYIDIEESCLNNCGKKRRYTLFPGGVYDTDAVRTYTNPRNWKVIPQDVNISRRHIQGEVIRRVNESIVAAAARGAAREEERQAGKPSAIAPVVFRGAGDGKND